MRWLSRQWSKSEWSTQTINQIIELIEFVTYCLSIVKQWVEIRVEVSSIDKREIIFFIKEKRWSDRYIVWKILISFVDFDISYIWINKYIYLSLN